MARAALTARAAPSALTRVLQDGTSGRRAGRSGDGLEMAFLWDGFDGPVSALWDVIFAFLVVIELRETFYPQPFLKGDLDLAVLP